MFTLGNGFHSIRPLAPRVDEPCLSYADLTDVVHIPSRVLGLHDRP